MQMSFSYILNDTYMNINVLIDDYDANDAYKNITAIITVSSQKDIDRTGYYLYVNFVND